MLCLKHLGSVISPVKARLAWGSLSSGLAQLSSSHLERNVLSFCGYNLFSLGTTCTRLDLAPGGRSARLARQRRLPRVPWGKGSAPRPPTFCPAPAPILRPLLGEGGRRGLSVYSPALAVRPRAPLLTLPYEHMSSHALLPGEAGKRTGMWAAMRPPDKGVAARPALAAAAAGQFYLGCQGVPASLPEAPGRIRVL